MAVSSIPEALTALGAGPKMLPRHPVIHGLPGTLFTLGLPGTGTSTEWVGVWVEKGSVKFFGEVNVPARTSAAHGLTGEAARVADLLADASRRFLERAEALDTELAELQSKGRNVPIGEVWKLQREVVALRALIGRGIVVASEVMGPFGSAFPGVERALPSVTTELGRVRELALTLQQSMSDLILLRNAEESNRIAETANALSTISNRIAVLTNTSNIRMLGITYIALVLGLVSATVLIPNTAATILGMPSAGWVPGPWVDVLIVALAVVPVGLVFSRPWVRKLLADLKASEARTAEGIRDLPELPASDAVPHRPPRSPSGPSASSREG